MGASLDFVTAAPVSEAVRQAIESEADAIDHDWWAEALSVGADRQGVGFLLGRCRLYLLAYETAAGVNREVDPDDDSLMAWRDAAFVVRQLEDWSRRHDVAWELRCEGQFVGRISDGGADAATGTFLAGLLALDQGAGEARAARIREIAMRHADRW